MLELNLPVPSNNLLNYIKNFSLIFPINEINISRKEKFEDYNFNLNIAMASHPTTDILHELVANEYGTFFSLHNTEFKVNCLLMQNYGTELCCVPPHTDIGRTVAINYVIVNGGTDVETTFYNQYSDDPAGVTASYANLEKVNGYKLNDHKWYSFDARQYHSVDKIQDTRLVLSISIWDHSFLKFKELYNHLIRREF